MAIGWILGIYLWTRFLSLVNENYYLLLINEICKPRDFRLNGCWEVTFLSSKWINMAISFRLMTALGTRIVYLANKNNGLLLIDGGFKPRDLWGSGCREVTL